MRVIKINRDELHICYHDGYYKFYFPVDCKNRAIFYTADYNFTNKELLTHCKDYTLSIATPIYGTRLFFEIVDEKGKQFHGATRLVEDIAVTNFRDLGGYETNEGKSVKWGRFYRSAQISNVSQRVNERMKSLGIRTVFDLRSEIEVCRSPDVLWDGCEYINAFMLKMEDNSGVHDVGDLDMESLVMQMISDEQRLNQLPAYMEQSYRLFADATDVLHTLFQTLLAKPGEPILFHCAAGKDRTGIVAALLLLLLGVDEQMVMEDYLLSNKCRQEENKAIISKIAPYACSERQLEIVNDLLKVRSDSLKQTLYNIRDRYGDFHSFWKLGIGLTESDIASLRQIYTE